MKLSGSVDKGSRITVWIKDISLIAHKSNIGGGAGPRRRHGLLECSCYIMKYAGIL